MFNTHATGRYEPFHERHRGENFFKVQGSRLLHTAAAALIFAASPLADAAKGNKGGPPNRAPQIEGVPDSQVRVGETYEFAPTASDSDGDPLTFTITNAPAWAGFDSLNGRLYGTPQDEDVGVTSGIVITVSDGQAEASLDPFSIEVLDQTGNRSPEISGTPETNVTVGQNYSFTPTASDADGDSLTFSVGNKPNWAAFDSTSGSLTGVATDGDVGVYESVSIAVSDGQAEASLPAFDIEVVSSGTSPGTANLSWTPPTERRDGSPLTNLGGFGIAYGKASRQYDQLIRIDNPGITTYLVESLSQGTWYFSVFAYDTDGMTSGFSNEGSKEIAKEKGPGGGKGKK
jgi:hypothetical protein